MTACIAIEILHPDTHFPVSTESSLSINRKKKSHSSVKRLHFGCQYNPTSAALSGLGQSTPCQRLDIKHHITLHDKPERCQRMAILKLLCLHCKYHKARLLLRKKNNNAIKHQVWSLAIPEIFAPRSRGLAATAACMCQERLRFLLLQECIRWNLARERRGLLASAWCTWKKTDYKA